MLAYETMRPSLYHFTRVFIYSYFGNIIESNGENVLIFVAHEQCSMGAINRLKADLCCSFSLNCV